MLERYKRALERRGIINLDSLNEDGTFKKELVNEDGKYESGYVGIIKVNDFNNPDDLYNVEVIYIRTEKNERRLVCDNFRGTFIQSELSMIEDRDPVTLFEDYSKDANLFIEIQKEKEYKRYLLCKATGLDEAEKQNIILTEDQIIDTLQSELEASRKM